MYKSTSWRSCDLKHCSRMYHSYAFTKTIAPVHTPYIHSSSIIPRQTITYSSITLYYIIILHYMKALSKQYAK